MTDNNKPEIPDCPDCRQLERQLAGDRGQYEQLTESQSKEIERLRVRNRELEEALNQARHIMQIYISREGHLGASREVQQRIESLLSK